MIPSIPSLTPNRRTTLPLLALALGWLLAAPPLPVFPQEQPCVSRAEIQRFMASDPGNSIRTRAWTERYQGRPITWRGEVFQVRRRPESHRLEILLKVLPDSILYDTVAVLEGDLEMDRRIQKHAQVEFSGKIFNGVDSFGLKEVQVLLREPSQIRLN